MTAVPDVPKPTIELHVFITAKTDDEAGIVANDIAEWLGATADEFSDVELEWKWVEHE